MKELIYTLSFKIIDEEELVFLIEDHEHRVIVRYDIKNEDFSFDQDDAFTRLIQKNNAQLRKIILSSQKGNVSPGMPIRFAFIPDFPFLKEEDFNQYIHVDRRGEELNIHVLKDETTPVYKIYADGSYADQTGQSAYAGIIEDPEGNQVMYQAPSASQSSNLMELLAVSEGLKRLEQVDVIQVNSDSRYVIRGLAQWVHFWKLNDWHTAQGSAVKYAEHWKAIDRLCEGKLLELKWIKAHSGDEKHGNCHQRAKEIATGASARGS